MANEIKISDELIISVMQGVIDNYLKPRFIELGMNATGQWIDSLMPMVVNGNGEIWGMDYTYWLSHGRKPGKAPPISALLTWVTAKFGVGGNEAKGIAFAVAQKIKNEGTRFYPEGTDLLTILESQEVIDYIYARFKQGFTIQINELLKKQLDDNFS